jgi:hypothetical protein
MSRHHVLIPFVLAAFGGQSGLSANVAGPRQEPHGDVQRILDKYKAAVPSAKELGLFNLDWAPTLQAAKERVAKQKRPILLMVVRNKYGNLYTGHC